MKTPRANEPSTTTVILPEAIRPLHFAFRTARIQTFLFLAIAVLCLRVHAAPGDERWADRFSPPGGSGFAFAVSGGDIYIGGALALVDGNPNSKNIGKWNGRSWTALSNGVDNTVRTIALDGTNLYAGGDFTNASGVAASRVAK